MPIKIYVTANALRYSNKSRADLWHNEIIQIVTQERWVYLGKNAHTSFMLVWDSRQNEPVVFLVLLPSHKKAVVVVSVWKAHFGGIPGGTPNPEQIEATRKIALTLEDPPPD